MQASRGDALEKNSYDSAFAQALEASRATAAAEAEEVEALRLAMEASLAESKQKNLGLGLKPAANAYLEKAMELAAQCTSDWCSSHMEERRIDPMPDDKRNATFSEICDVHSGQGLTEYQLTEHWNQDIAPVAATDVPASRIIKATFGQDTRRLRAEWTSGAPADVLAVLQSTIEEGFGLPKGFATPPAYFLKYHDDEGDLCTLVNGTLGDFLDLSLRGGPLKVVLEKHLQTKSIEGMEGFSIGTPPASPRDNVSEICSQSIEDDYESSWSLVEAEQSP